MSALILEFRNILQQVGKYAGSKLALMDAYHVKKSSLASGPIHIERWKLPQLPKERKKKPRANDEDCVASVVVTAPRAPPKNLRTADLNYGVALSRTPRHCPKK